eukprot:5331993-Lingulodinium_polyedra.AAC.1
MRALPRPEVVAIAPLCVKSNGHVHSWDIQVCLRKIGDAALTSDESRIVLSRPVIPTDASSSDLT